MNSIATPRTGIFPLEADLYHADKSAVSKSMLSAFRYSRRLYFHQHVACDAPPEKSSRKMDLGTLAHIALLEPERMDDAYAIFPRDVLAKNGADSTNASDAFRKEHEAAGRVVVKAEQFETVQRMTESVRAKIGHWLRIEKRIEHAVYWTDPHTEMLCRCRPDWLVLKGDTAFCLDFKTTDTIVQFSRAAESCDYWLQDAHYSEGLRIALQCDVEFYFVVVQTAFPWSCALFELTPNDKHMGHTRRLIDLSELAECHGTGDWRDSWDRDEVVPLSLRPFVYQPPRLRGEAYVD